MLISPQRTHDLLNYAFEYPKTYERILGDKLSIPYFFRFRKLLPYIITNNLYVKERINIEKANNQSQNQKQ